MIIENSSLGIEKVNRYLNSDKKDTKAIKILNQKEFERKLEYHIFRGYSILSISLKANSNIYEFILQEFT